MDGYLVLESGEVFQGEWISGEPRAGEVVFNTSHSGFEEMATDPSYFKQILVCTAPQQGNYGSDKKIWESGKIHIEGFVCLDIQNTKRENSWIQTLNSQKIPILHQLDTRKITLTLRNKGTPWGALVPAKDKEEALNLAKALIQKAKAISQDWPYLVSTQSKYELKGECSNGYRIALIDYGVKKNILNHFLKWTQSITVFPSRTPADQILNGNFDAVILSNGPGDPASVQESPETIKKLIGKIPIFGICMGHQLLAIALGGKTYKLKFGHRGANHPIQDFINNSVYMTSQNHGYAVDSQSLPIEIGVTHKNLYDNTVAGISYPSKKLWSVQFHPESSPGPNDASYLFKYFIEQIQ